MHRQKIILAGALLVAFVALGIIFNPRFFSGKKTAEGSTLAKIKKEGRLVVGTNAKYPPFESIDENGEFVGMDMEIIREIAKDLGVKPIFQDVIWEELFDRVKDRSIDMAISSITITNERAQTMAFSDPYINAGQVIVSTADKKEIIRTPEDLAAFKVGVQRETTSEKEARKYAKEVFTYKNYPEAYVDLFAGITDAIVLDYPAAVAVTAKDKRLFIVSDIFTQEFYGIATHKDQEQLIAHINKTIRRLKRDGVLKKLEGDWLGQ